MRVFVVTFVSSNISFVGSTGTHTQNSIGAYLKNDTSRMWTAIWHRILPSDGMVSFLHVTCTTSREKETHNGDTLYFCQVGRFGSLTTIFCRWPRRFVLSNRYHSIETHVCISLQLKECGVFGVTYDEFVMYAHENRREWIAKGESIVADMLAECQQKNYDNGAKASNHDIVYQSDEVSNGDKVSNHEIVYQSDEVSI
jgi:hypothetical protein